MAKHEHIKTKEPSLEEAKRYLDLIDFSMIINKMVVFDDWLRADAEVTSQFYKNFLFLKKKYAREYEMPPSLDIDEFWHYHILDTEKYQTDCEAIFGYYLHHYPYFGIDAASTREDLNNAFQIVQDLHVKEFGSLIYPTRTSRSKWVNKIRKEFLFFISRNKRVHQTDVASNL